MFRIRISTLIIHITGWLLFLILPVLFLNSGNKENSAWVLLTSSYYWLFCLTYLFLFYFNLRVLIPYFFLRKKYTVYALSVIALFYLVYFLQPFDKLLGHNPRIQAAVAAAGPPPPDGLNTKLPIDTAPAGPSGSVYYGELPHHELRMQVPESKPSGLPPLWQHSSAIDVVSLVLFVIITALSLSVRTVEQWQTTEQKVITAESEKVHAELSFLKAQINPHFLFNTLNNIYTLSVMNSQHTPESIMKLSNIMRYVTDDVTQDFVPLQSDIDCLKDYIDLQRLRLGKKTEVNFKVEGEITHQRIAPLILMSFVENTFKYGVSKQDTSKICVEIKITGTEIRFCCQNRIFNNRTSVTERTGIGIANTRQRLQHLYPGRHQLQITSEDGVFIVKLILT